MKARIIRWAAVVAFGLAGILIGWVYTHPPLPPSPPPAPAKATLSLEPAEGPPGTEVTVRIRLPQPETAWAGGDGKSWNFQLCWEKCGPRQLEQSVWPKPSEVDRYLFTGKVKVPAYLNGARLRAGAAEVQLACATAPGEDCLEKPEARAFFRITGELPGTAWESLPQAEFKPVAALDSHTSLAVDPTNSKRQVKCQSGSPRPDAPEGPPHLRVTADGWATWETISLQGAPLGQMAGLSGCRVVALDPVTGSSFFVAGSGHRGLPGAGRYPWPYFTMDAGATWKRVPFPDGYQDAEGFLGFETAPDGVIAWFAGPGNNLPAAFAGQKTKDGGRTWEPIPLGCPAGAACVREIPAVLYSRLERGLLRSDDGGMTWSWAEWEGARLQAWNRGFQATGEVLEVAGAMSDPGGAPYRFAPLLRSTDGGKSWTWVDVPEPPGGWHWDPDLRLEPDGALLYRNSADRRFRLRRGESTWVQL